MSEPNTDPNAPADNAPPVADTVPVASDGPVELGDGRTVEEKDGHTYYTDPHGSVYVTPGTHSDVVIALHNLNLI